MHTNEELTVKANGKLKFFQKKKKKKKKQPGKEYVNKLWKMKMKQVRQKCANLSVNQSVAEKQRMRLV